MKQITWAMMILSSAWAMNAQAWTPPRPPQRPRSVLVLNTGGPMQRFSTQSFGGQGNVRVNGTRSARPGIIEALKQIAKQSNGIVQARDTIVVTSAYRDPERNRRVGGASRSAHLTGEAIDFAVSPNFSPYGTARRVEGSKGRVGVGRALYNSCRPHVHIDLRRGVMFDECRKRSRKPRSAFGY